MGNLTYGSVREQLELLSQKERFDQALAKLLEVESSRSLSLSELVQKARLIQLHSGEILSIDNVAKVLEQALEIDPENPTVLLELGWYSFNVLDDPAQAADYFTNAAQHLSDSLSEAMRGFRDCSREMRENS